MITRNIGLLGIILSGILMYSSCTDDVQELESPILEGSFIYIYNDTGRLGQCDDATDVNFIISTNSNSETYFLKGGQARAVFIEIEDMEKFNVRVEQSQDGLFLDEKSQIIDLNNFEVTSYRTPNRAVKICSKSDIRFYNF